MFNKKNLEKVGKVGLEYAKEESKGFISDLIQGFLIKITLIIITIGVIFYFTFSGFFYVKEKVGEVKEATTAYVGEKKAELSEEVDKLKETSLNKIDTVKSNATEKFNNVKEGIEEVKTNATDKINDVKEESVSTFNKENLKTEPSPEEVSPEIEKQENEIKSKMNLSYLKEKVSDLKEKISTEDK